MTAESPADGDDKAISTHTLRKEGDLRASATPAIRFLISTPTLRLVGDGGLDKAFSNYH